MDNSQQEKRPAENNSRLADNTEAARVIPVVEEFVTVQREILETGKVHIRKTVTEEQALINLPITNESYDIERVAVNEVRDTPPPSVRYEGDVMIIPVTKEITVIQKRYEVVEELRITRKVTETPNMQEITLMKEQVHVERKHHNDDAPERF
jgi:uncharacterized protein (TIGR02271 family)